MSRLTLEQIAESAAVHHAYGDGRCQAHEPSEPWPCEQSVLLDYARLQAALEALEAKLPEGAQFTTWRCFHEGMLGRAVEANWHEDEYQRTAWASGRTLADAYANLLSKLETER